MLKKLKSFLTHPLVRDLDIDSPETSQIVSRLIQEQSFLKKIYISWYQSISRSLPNGIGGQVLELGSGAGFLGDYIPDLITSEILPIPHIDMVLDGRHLPFSRASLRGIVMLDVFHHIPSVKSFLLDAAFSVMPGGVIIMIEPWVTPWSRWLFRNLHHEPFDSVTAEWEFPPGGPLSQSNQALPWIVFDRDRQIFEQEFPQWKVKEISLHTPFCYILSGGVSLRSFMPGFSFGIWRMIENMMTPWMHFWAMFATIILERGKDNEPRKAIMYGF